MDELLARHTGMTIHRVSNGMTVEPDSIYLIPPKKEMIVSGGRLLLTDRSPQRDLSLPIDHFLRSLAQDAGARAIGLRHRQRQVARHPRRARPGAVIAQTPAPQFDGMPPGPDTGVVDLMLHPRRPAWLIAQARQEGRRQAPRRRARRRGVDLHAAATTGSTSRTTSRPSDGASAPAGAGGSTT
jgi:two-component system CheB/CheR fusion protein